jgi:hypothetical protein
MYRLSGPRLIEYIVALSATSFEMYLYSNNCLSTPSKRVNQGMKDAEIFMRKPWGYPLLGLGRGG